MYSSDGAPPPLSVRVDKVVARVDEGGEISFTCTHTGGQGRVVSVWSPTVSKVKAVFDGCQSQYWYLLSQLIYSQCQFSKSHS